jgi:formylglycine-generating enzyme required for sulfatase activity
MTAAGKEPGATTHQVFISYANENINSTSSDRNVADQICSALESQSIRCWIAHRNILPGDEWLNAIIDAVERSKIIILVFSANTEQSQWVKDEITLALNREIKIIPFRIENVSPRQSLRILDVRCQWMDAFTPPLEKHIGRLVEVVGEQLGKEPAVPIKKKKLNDQPGADQVKSAAKKIRVVKEKTGKSPDMPEDVKKVISKAHKVDKNKNGYWEAYYQDGIIMVYIPPGKFTMGSDEGEEIEKPSHEVELDGYWMGKIPVTNMQYVSFLNDSGIDHKTGCNGERCINTDIESKDSHIKCTKDNYQFEPGCENHPVIAVSWYGAAEYCKWLSKKIGQEFKLPTEAQWENAARGNDQRKYPWGSKEPNIDLANFNRNIGKTTPVGSYPEGASPYGLMDMAGNVWEWCSDWYEAYYYKISPLKNPTGPNRGSNRVIRGGNWRREARFLCCTYRSHTEPSTRYVVLGFRLRQD